jgi:anaerobic selenocysteine-containing dehydrogenase
MRPWRKMEFIATVERFMPPAAEWADMVLPSCIFLERNDFTFGEEIPHFGYQNKVVDPVGESQTSCRKTRLLLMVALLPTPAWFRWKKYRRKRPCK